MKKNTLFTKTAMLAVIALTTLIGASQAETVITPQNIYDPNLVHELYIIMDAADYEEMRYSSGDNNGETPGAGTVYAAFDPNTGRYEHEYWQAYMADNQSMIDAKAVAVRRKSDVALASDRLREGDYENGYDPNTFVPEKFSLKIDISRPGFTLEGQRFGGKKKLSIESGDGKAFVTEGLSWNIYNMAGVVSGRANWIKIYISTNGGASFDYKGLFANVEQVDEEYLEDHMPGRHDYGFLWKRHELGGDYLKTRWPETDPFQFNWYPFDHMGGGSEVPTPADWLVQAEERVNMDQLLKFAAAENFIQNTDGTINKGNNFWYYDWANGPDPNIMDPSYAQPRMYFPWDLDTTMDPLVPPTLPIINDLNGNMVEGLILEEDEGGTPYGYPTFQADYYGKYAGIVNGPLTKPNLLALITTIESAIATEIDADPFLGGPGTAAAEFARLRTYVQDRWDFVASELAAVTFDLTTSVVNDGSVIVNPDRIQFGDGEIAELTAVANSGVFLRWEGDVTSTDNPLLLTMDSDKSVTAVFSASGTDITPPTPAPTFAVAPYATGSTSIAMASTIAVDPNGVEYYFTCTSGGGNDSGWISENSYEDAGLTPGGTYTYTVKARDLSVNYNQTAQSAGSGATTMSGLIPAVDDLVDRETAIDGTVSGTYLDVQASDDVYESITEREQLGGPPNSKYSYLEHEWEIDVTGSDPLTLFVEAYGTDTSAEGDTYSFTYSVDGGSNYFAIGTVGATESVISVALPAMGGTGTVIVKVVDDDHTASNRTLDTLYVDEIYVNFPGGGTIPGQDVIISPADIATDVGIEDDLSWTPGADSTGTQVYFGTDPTPDATEYQGNFAGATFDPGTLLEDTTYYVRLDAVNAYDITKGTVTSFTTQTLDVTVPDVTGQAQATAEGNIVAAGLTVGTVSSVCDASPAGTVLSQSPVGGGSVPPGTAVDLTVSSGPPSVPSYVGGTEAAAIAGLGGIADVSYGTSSYVCDASAAGTVLSQSATGIVACGAVIDLTVSSGPPSVPSYVGGTEAAAIAGLGSISNVSYGTSSYVCDASAAGTVLSQSATGIVACGAVIDLTVSSGSPSVPSYVGGTEAAAIAGLGSISNVSYGISTGQCDASPAGTVLAQSATGVVACGAVIDLTVSSGPPSVPSYLGGTEGDAVAALGSISNVSYGTSSYVCDASAAGTVLSQSATGIVACGAVIDLTVSSGPPSAPDVTGMDEASAIAAINGTANISYGSSTSVCDASAAGTVLSQSATGTVACGAVIDLTVSSGQPSVPDLTGGDEATAIATLGGIADISYGTSTGQCDASPAGTVLAQSATGTVPCGTVINLTVSTGEPSAPDVTGLDEATAVATLNGTADISVGTVTYVCDAAPIGICLSQSATGTVPCGTSIDIVVSSGPADAPDVTGMDEATAIATLNGTANISYGSSSNQYDDVVPLGDVISQSATGTVGCGAVIDLVISDGPADRLISGTLTEPDDTTAIEGILIELSDGSASDVTDPNGYYELVVDYGWSGIVEPNAVGFVFDPNETLRTLTSVASDTVLDLTGSLEVLVISGTILDDGAVPLSGVTVTPDNGGGYYTNKYDGGGVGVTDAAGYYEVLVDYDWSGSVTPTDNAYTFAPLSSSYSNVAGPVAAQDYTGTMLTFSITGTIENVLGAPVEGVTVTADNGGGTDTSDPTGYYEVWVSYDWSGNVTLSMADYTFTPPSTAYANVTINQAQDFTAQLDADIDGDGFVGLPDLIILCENWLMVGDLSMGDLDDSGFIDMGDVAELGGYWQQ